MKKMLLAITVVASFIVMGDTWKDPNTDIKWAYEAGGEGVVLTGQRECWGKLCCRR